MLKIKDMHCSEVARNTSGYGIACAEFTPPHYGLKINSLGKQPNYIFQYVCTLTRGADALLCAHISG